MITEQQVREVFELVFAVRERWTEEVGGGSCGEFVKLDGHALVFTDGRTEDGDNWEYMRLATLFDYDAIAAPYIKARKEAQEREEQRRQAMRRQQYENLRQEFEG